VKQSPERDANGRPIRKNRRQTVDLKVLLADDDDDSDDHSYADNSAEDDDDSDEDQEAGAINKQSGQVMEDNSNTLDEDLKDSSTAAEIDSKLSNRGTSDVEPPKKRRKLVEVETEDERAERLPSEISNGDASDKRSGESVSPSSRGRKKVLNQKLDDDDDEVEKWAKAIINYHQQTEDIRTRYVSCCMIDFCAYILMYGTVTLKMTFCLFLSRLSAEIMVYSSHFIICYLCIN